MLDWLRELDIGSLLLRGVIGRLLSTWHSYYVKRPKLKLIGMGGASIRVSNVPGFFGLAFPHTVVLGRLLHGDKELGLPIDRDPARDCTAVLYDKETGQHVANLYFQVTDDTTRSTVTLDSGNSANILIFNRAETDRSTYYPWRPDNEDSSRPAAPREVDAMFNSTREFNIVVRYAHGRKKVEFPVRMIRGFDGRLSFYSPVGGGTF